jgi:FixJ family two-component response regulator
MPGVNGLELQSQLAARGSRLPIIFITGYDDTESRRRAMQAGAVAFLAKPFSDELLLQAVRSVLAEFNRECGVASNLISIVDDDESVRRTTTLLIRSFGLRAEAFESAEKFLSSGCLNDTRCLIVDLQMPGVKGLELQGQLAARGSRVPIIFITGCDDTESGHRAMQAGAVAFLAKPFRDEQLLQAIHSALRYAKVQGGDDTITGS